MGWAGILEDTNEIFTVENADNKFLELLTEKGKNNKSKPYMFDMHLPIR